MLWFGGVWQGVNLGSRACTLLGGLMVNLAVDRVLVSFEKPEPYCIIISNASTLS